MNILIIAKMYHDEGRARAVQMRRVFKALKTYTNHNIVLITAGGNSSDNNDVINIPDSSVVHPKVKRVFDRLVMETEIVKPSTFYENALNIAKIQIKENSIDVLFTASSPIDSHLVGLELKKQFPQIRWMAFFSDIWPFSLLPEPYFRKKIFSSREENLTKKILLNSDIVLTPSCFAVKMLKQKFGNNNSIFDVPHCLEESNFKSINQTKTGYVVHTGSLQKERINEALIQAIKELSFENNNFKGFIHIGAYDDVFKRLIDDLDCPNIKIFERMSEFEAKKLQSEFSIGMIIESKMGDVSPFMPSKITDCIQLHQKIVCITPKQSFLSNFCASNNGLYACEYEKNAIKKSILDALNQEEYINHEAINYFYPKKIAERYNNFFRASKTLEYDK